MICMSSLLRKSLPKVGLEEIFYASNFSIAQTRSAKGALVCSFAGLFSPHPAPGPKGFEETALFGQKVSSSRSECKGPEEIEEMIITQLH